MSNLLRTPPVDRRTFHLRPPAVAIPEAQPIHTEEALCRAREEAAGLAALQARAEFEGTRRALEERSRRDGERFLSAARELGLQRRAILVEASDAVLTVALAVARRILRREIAFDATAVLPLVRELLQRAAAGSNVVVRLSPQDHAALTERVRSLPEAEGLDGVRLRIDPTVTPGGCVVETESGSLDARLETQLERLENALRPPQVEAA